MFQVNSFKSVQDSHTLSPSKQSHPFKAVVNLFVHKLLGWVHAGYLWRPGASMVCPSGTEPDHSHCLYCRPATPSLHALQVNATPQVNPSACLHLLALCPCCVLCWHLATCRRPFGSSGMFASLCSIGMLLAGRRVPATSPE